MQRLDKIREKSSQIFHIIFFASFFWLLYNVVFLEAYQEVKIKSDALLIAGLLLSILIVALKNKKRLAFLYSDDVILYTLLTIFLSMFILQITVGYMLRIKPVTDLEAVDNFAKTVAKTGSFENIYANFPDNRAQYMARYPANNGLFLMLCGFYRVVYLLFGYIPRYAPTFLTTILVFAAVVFVTLIAKRTKGNKYAFVVAMLCLLFVPYYTFLPYYYTDATSIPFGVISVYFFICALKPKDNIKNQENKIKSKRIKKLLLMLLSGIFLALAFIMKGNAVIILPVLIIYLILSMNIKRLLAFGLILVIGFCGTYASFSAMVGALHFETEEQRYANEFPLEHWVMMGSVGNGGYRDEDRAFTSQFKNKDLKREAAIEELKKRLKEQSFSEFLEHLGEKARYTWAEGTYHAEYHIYTPVKKSFLHDYVLLNSKNFKDYFSYTNGWQMLLVFFICVSFGYGVKKRKINYDLIFKGVVALTFIFFLIWETRSRYIFNMTPFMMLLFADGIFIFDKQLKEIKSFLDYKKRLIKNQGTGEEIE